HYGWDESKAKSFVVSGRTPIQLVEGEVDEVRHEDHARYRIRLTIQSWVSIKTVSESYRFYQREALGGRNRPLSSKSLALFRFVTGRMGPGGAVSSWRSLMKDWNRKNPGNVYAEVRLFHRD